jgi:hypothetical protein
MGRPLKSIHFMLRSATLVLAIWLSAAGTHAQDASPLGRLAGQWSGSGTIDLADGSREPIRCRASYDVLDQERNVQLNIRCASQSYNFDLRGSANYAGGAITGTWSESTRNAAGTIAGKAHGGQFEVVASAPSFTASLTLVTRGDRQAVTIRSQNAESTTIKAVSITLRRS